jgi:hypothetical protein
MGDKSPKQKNRNKAQKASHEKAAQQKATAKQVKTPVQGKGKS